MLVTIYNPNDSLKYYHKKTKHSSTPTFFKTRKKLKISMKNIGYEGINPRGGTVDFMGAFKTVSTC